MKFLSFIKKHKIGALFAIIAAALVSTAALTHLNSQNQTQTTSQAPLVSLISVADYTRAAAVNLDNGTVESIKQADLKAQITAQIVSINAKLGDNVFAGQVLAKLQDKDLRAQLEQAQAKLDELKSGSRPQDLKISQNSADQTKTALANSIKDAYAKSDDAVRNHIDKFFANASEKNAQFLIAINVNGALVNFQPPNADLADQAAEKRYALEPVLNDWQKTIAALESAQDSDIEKAADLSLRNLQQQIDFLNFMAPLVNNLASDNSTYKTIIDGYKTEFSAARSALAGALASLQASQTAWKTAKLSLDYKLAGASEEQIRQAQAGVDALKAVLAKTEIMAPISGKISYIAGNAGELVSAGQLIATIVNPAALQVKTYASENDLPQIKIGSPAEIDGGARGIVSNVSPAIDRQSKKAEVIVAVIQNAKMPIVIGQNVSVKISAKDQNNADFFLPIEAIQFTDAGSFAFTANRQNILEAVPVQTGELVGESIKITGGLVPEMKILSSVRGFKAGDQIKIQE